jgi:hypothetical protein
VGTFHPHAHELHGITCVVDRGPAGLAVGRVDTVDATGVVLLDADVYREEPGSPGRDEWLANAAQWGVWKKFDRIVVPAAEVASIRRLGDLR